MTEHKHILLADDDPNDVELLLAALADYRVGNHITVVRDGIEALDYLFRRGAFADRPPVHPIVILLDLKMPRADGLDVLRQVKADPQLHLIPVVMLTSSREERDIVRSYELGANAYVVKPVGFGDFAEVVRQLGLFWIVTNQAPGPPAVPFARA